MDYIVEIKDRRTGELNLTNPYVTDGFMHDTIAIFDEYMAKKYAKRATAASTAYDYVAIAVSQSEVAR
jgi:hypothetical protein